MNGETKMELRGHEHTIEVVVFAPPAAYAAIRELAGIPVSRISASVPIHFHIPAVEYRKVKTTWRLRSYRFSRQVDQDLGYPKRTDVTEPCEHDRPIGGLNVSEADH